MKQYKILSLLVVIAMLLAACGGGAAAPAPAAEAPAAAATDTPAAAEAAAPTDTPAAAAEAPAAAPAEAGAKEAPVLAKMVADGKIPPLEERLPKDPFVVGPGVLLSETSLANWEPGQYKDGSVIRTAHSVADWAPDVFVMLNEPLLQAPDLGVQNIQGNVVKSFEVANDNKEFTFHLREGLKWSDGEPVTTEDVRFTWENIWNNEKVSPSGVPNNFRTGYSPDGDPAKLDIVDDYTFKLTYSASYGGFLRAITIEGWNGYTLLINPAHVLKKWHADFTSLDDMKAELEKNNLKDEWWTLFTQKWCQNWNVTAERCIGYPTLNPWVSVAADTPSTKIFERNPYYFKVDTEGKQLPYIDKIVSQQVEDVEAVNLKVMNGEVDFLRESTGLVKVPLYKENEEKGGFNTVLLDMHVNSSVLFLNQTFDNPTWQKLAQDVRFRQALSHAINRQEIIDSVYYTFAGMPSTLVGDENDSYDVDKANALLDELGMKDKDSDGFRKGPDGQPFSILLEHGAHAPDLEPIAELLAAQLKEVGINLQVKRIDSTLWGQRRDANELQATVFWGNDQGWDDDRLGGNPNIFGQEWNLWHTSKGKEGTEAPDWVKKYWDLNVARWSAVSGSDEYNKLAQQGLDWAKENLPQITLVENVKYPMIANKKLHNVPSAGYAIACNFAGEQLWYGE
ncbi:MAG: ABC transporter substrate-binding protein [Caldilineaceae bacterium]